MVILRIPLVEYLVVLLLNGLIALGLQSAERIRNQPAFVQLISEKQEGLK